MADNAVDITLFGKHYRVACAPEEVSSLQEAVQYLDQRLRENAAKTGASGEKLAVMTALNVTHEFLQFQRAGGFDMPAFKRRIEVMNLRLNHLITQHDKA